MHKRYCKKTDHNSLTLTISCSDSLTGALFILAWILKVKEKILLYQLSRSNWSVNGILVISEISQEETWNGQVTEIRHLWNSMQGFTSSWMFGGLWDSTLIMMGVPSLKMGVPSFYIRVEVWKLVHPSMKGFEQALAVKHQVIFVSQPFVST